MDNTEKQNQKSEVDKSAEEQEAYLKVVKPVRTYERDLAAQVREGGASTVSVHLKERKKKRASKNPLGKTVSVSRFAKLQPILTVLTILVAVGALAFTTFSLFINPQNTEEAAREKGVSIVNADSVITLDLSDRNRDGIIRALQENLGTPPSGLWVTSFLPIQKNVFGIARPLRSASFFSTLSDRIPSKFLRASGEIVNLGFLTFSDKREGFILSQIVSFDNAFAGMLDWEKSIVVDLESIITSSNDSPSGGFRDIVLKNKDSRILRDKSGKSILIYSFIENDILLIARNEETFREILDRYVATKFKN